MTVTVDQPTVTVRALARTLGVAPLADDVVAHAAEHGVTLHVGRDWSGQPAVPAGDAAELVAAAEARAAQRAETKRRHQREIEAERVAAEREIAAAAQDAYDRVFTAGLHNGDRDAELRAWLAALNAGLERQAQLAEVEQPATSSPPHARRWWQR